MEDQTTDGSKKLDVRVGKNTHLIEIYRVGGGHVPDMCKGLFTHWDLARAKIAAYEQELEKQAEASKNWHRKQERIQELKDRDLY